MLCLINVFNANSVQKPNLYPAGNSNPNSNLFSNLIPNPDILNIILGKTFRLFSHSAKIHMHVPWTMTSTIQSCTTHLDPLQYVMKYFTVCWPTPNCAGGLTGGTTTLLSTIGCRFEAHLRVGSGHDIIAFPPWATYLSGTMTVSHEHWPRKLNWSEIFNRIMVMRAKVECRFIATSELHIYLE